MTLDPKDPILPIDEGAIAMHTMFLALVNAGFEESQAVTLTAMLTIAAQTPTQPTE